ncbi:beta-galactosidase family protein [Microbacterium sp. NPDC089698]|uniref:glycoside hydrolase family 35 protein n=1 Tax=Microbacterium sp. NPDC089698 TaxID=3364200 RepID=UPI00382DD5FD
MTPAPRGRWIDEGQVFAGAMHYFRVHPEHWADRLARLAAMGLTAVETYVPWNFHEYRRGEHRFDGWRDLPRFLELAAEAGLDAIVRPGPYICAEWDAGGLPAWLQFDGPIGLRTSDPAFLAPVDEWFAALLPRLAPLQADRGGPVIAVQVENEYGSFGDDAEYLAWLERRLRAGGITVPLFTSDGATDLMVDAGTLPGVTPTMNFGSRAAATRAFLEQRFPATPFFGGEFWAGWFDHWGEQHHRRSGASAADPLREIVEAGGSINIYMAHGGTNFGLWAGANHYEERLHPTVTSYDSDAAIAEDGTLTEKFAAFRTVFAAAGAEPRPEPAPPRRQTPRDLAVEHGAGLLKTLEGLAGAPVTAPRPLSFEELGQSSGIVLYETSVRIPQGGAALRVRGLADRAEVFVDGEHRGVLHRNDPDATIALDGDGSSRRLVLAVESLGRINYGPLLGEGKGILGGVGIEAHGVIRSVFGWEHRGLDPNAEAAPSFTPFGDPGPTGLSRAVAVIGEPLDAHLELPGWGRGLLWLNGFLLGRYDEAGPQRTYYAPAGLWRQGENEILLLEAAHRGDAVGIRDRADLGPVTDYVEWQA